MDSVFKDNVTLSQVMNFFNLSVSNVINASDVSQVHLFDLYEAYRSREREQLIMYKWIAYVLGTLIIISNLTVVISSGLILRKGQQHKSTYLLLGNVSLADTIIGFSIIFGASVDNSMASNQRCIFQLGMIVCPAIVSIFSVGFIAVDRYIYILHGLYYQRWFNSTRVRIGIVCIWLIGISFGFTPTVGWVNQEYIFNSRCNYIAVYPGPLILLNSFLSVIPIVLVAILYTIILIKALKNLKSIKHTQKSVQASLTDLESNDKPKLRINRANTKTTNNTQSVKMSTKKCSQLKRSASFSTNDNSITLKQTGISSRSKSIDDLSFSVNSQTYVNRMQNNTNSDGQSNFSVYTIESNCSNENSFVDVTESPINDSKCIKGQVKKKNFKVKGPNKWRAVTIVMLTLLSFVICWMPFFITVIVYVLCEEKLTNPKCIYIRTVFGGPLATLAFVNSVLNPLIYAWWHKGFQKSIKNYFRKYIQEYFFTR